MTPKRVTNAQVLAAVEGALQLLASFEPAPDQTEALREIQRMQREDHDALIALGTTMEFVKGATKRWDANHTVVAGLKQRQGLISWVGGIVTLGVVGEAIRRAFEFFTK